MLIGDVRAMLKTLPDDHFDCVVTSPPYWGLRDYGVAGQIGLEPTLGEHLAVMVDVFNEVRRVLKPTGTLWLNYGDCYATAPNGRSAADTKIAGNDDRTFRDKPFSTIGGMLKAKDLAMLPNRLAIALQEPRYVGKIKSEADRIWLAAIIDGEGSIYIHRQPEGTKTGRDGKRTQDNFCVGIAISNCSESIVRKAAAICGKENIHMVDAKGGNRRDHYHWRVTGNIAKAILTEIYPYLVAKQREARAAISCPPSGDIATATWLALKDFHKGRSTDFDARPPNVSVLWEPGWWVRSEIIWGKTNPMPDSSGNYRPSGAHEKIFMLTKSDDGEVYRARDTGEISFCPDLTERCSLVTDQEREGPRWMRMGAYYDAVNSKQFRTSDEDAVTFRGGSYVGGKPGKRTVTGNKRIKMPDGWDAGEGSRGSRHRRGREAGKMIEVTPRHQGHINHTGLDELGRGDGRLLRNYEPAPLAVWPMSTQSFSEAHFATFPPELAERCIKAGCPAGGSVLDPFGGAGTTALVAVTLGRSATLIELNPEYAILARARIEAVFMGRDQAAHHMVKTLGKTADPGPLFGGVS